MMRATRQGMEVLLIFVALLLGIGIALGVSRAVMEFLFRAMNAGGRA
jgi:hypothetical protein